MKKPNLAILGATGAVGAEFITLIEERNFPYENLNAVLLLLITPVHSVWIQRCHSLCLKLTLKIF